MISKGSPVTETIAFASSRVVDAGDGRRVELRWAAISDSGRRREVNQDSLLVEFPILAVADGMGGYTAGEVASAAVTGRLEQLASRSAGDVSPDGLEEALRLAVSDLAESLEDVSAGTGTTVTGLVFDGSSGRPAWTVFNIGDSRVYRLDGDVLSQVTTDHSVVQELISIGAITPDEADSHPHGNVITRAVGFSEDPVPDYVSVGIENDARWVVCSDGLTKELTDYGIRHYLLLGSTPEEAARLLVDAAVENGGRDNISVIVLDVLLGGAEGEHAVGAWSEADVDDDTAENAPTIDR
jgi:protein phosphatase